MTLEVFDYTAQLSEASQTSLLLLKWPYEYLPLMKRKS